MTETSFLKTSFSNLISLLILRSLSSSNSSSSPRTTSSSSSSDSLISESGPGWPLAPDWPSIELVAMPEARGPPPPPPPSCSCSEALRLRIFTNFRTLGLRLRTLRLQGTLRVAAVEVCGRHLVSPLEKFSRRHKSTKEISKYQRSWKYFFLEQSPQEDCRSFCV